MKRMDRNSIRTSGVVLTLCFAVMSAGAATQPQILLPVVTANETPGFGQSIAAGSGLLAVAAQGGGVTSASVFGYVDVFQRGPSGWTRQTPLKAVDTRNFGELLAMSGEWLAVQSIRETGFIEVIDLFRRAGNSWEKKQRISFSKQPNVPSAGHIGFLGQNDLILYSQDYTFSGQITATQIFTYHFDGNSWVGPSNVVPPTPIAFALTIAQSGDRLVIADPYALASVGSGAVYTFSRDQGQWIWLSTMTQQSNPGLGFGGSLAFCSNRLAVGATVPNLAPNAPALVQLYEPVQTGWDAVVAPITVADPPRSFAQTLACDNNVLAIAAPGAGIAYRVMLDHSGSSTPEPLATTDNQSFGAAIAVNAHDVLVGNPDQVGATNNLPGTGAVYAFDDDTLFAAGFQ